MLCVPGADGSSAGKTGKYDTHQDTRKMLDDRFVEACQMHCYIEYMADVLTVGDLEERWHWWTS